MLIHGGKPIKEITSKYGVSKSTIFTWIKKNIQTKKFIEYKKYEILQKELEHTKLKLEIYENLHCFKDASIHDKEFAIAKYLGQYPIKTMCKILDLPTGTFYNYHFRKKEVTQNQIRDEELKAEITKVYLESEKRFGAKKIFAKLQSNGFRTSLKKIQKLMNELNIKSIQKTQKKETRKPDTDYQFNKLKRLFNQREEYNAKEYKFFEDLENSVDSYMEFYNNYRPHEALKNKTPNQFEAEFYENLAIKKSQISL